MVRELIQQCGVEGCGGATRGIDALVRAAANQRVDIIAILTDADTRRALTFSISEGLEASVKILLQHKGQPSEGGAYVDARDPSGTTALVCSIDVGVGRLCLPRIARLLLDAGADPTSDVRMTGIEGGVIWNSTPLELTNYTLREKGGFSTGEQLNRLKAMRRLLLQVEAVHAVSWLWPRYFPSITEVQEGARWTKTPSTVLSMMLQIMRQRAARRRYSSVLSGNLLRWEEIGDVIPIPVYFRHC